MIIAVIRPRRGMSAVRELLCVELAEYERKMLEMALMQVEIIGPSELPEDQESGELPAGTKQFGGCKCVPRKRKLIGHLIAWYTSGFE